MFTTVNLIVFAACTALGQSTAAQSGLKVGFEVASIKPSDPAARGMQLSVSPDGFTAKNVTVKGLIEDAYDVRDFQVSEGPGWLNTEKYDIVAKGNGIGVSEDDLGKMTDEQRELIKKQLLLKLQALLADRSQLTGRRKNSHYMS
jgi:uncharacterized protein (TIGR03435 family)